MSGLFRLTLYNRRRADRSRARSRRGAFSRRRALNNRAARARARWALSRFSLTLAVINDYRLRLRNTALQYVFTQVGHRRTFRF